MSSSAEPIEIVVYTIVVYFGAQEVFQFDLDMNNNINCTHYIFREDYWWPLRAASKKFFQKKADIQTHKHTHKQVRAENSPNKGLIL